MKTREKLVYRCARHLHIDADDRWPILGNSTNIAGFYLVTVGLGIGTAQPDCLKLICVVHPPILKR